MDKAKYKAARAAQATATAAPESRVIASVETLRGLKTETLIDNLKSADTAIQSRHVEGGKVASILAERKPDEEKTLKGYLKKQGVEPHTHTLSCAVAFGMVGEGRGFVAESVYDQTSLRWLLVVSPILNVLAKDFAEDTALHAEVRKEVAEVLDTRPTDGHKKLKAILATLKPKAEGEGEGEGDAESETGESAEMTLRDALKFIRDAIPEASAEDLALIRDTCTALATVAGDKLTPATVAA